jgi:hypothetical protein
MPSPRLQGALARHDLGRLAGELFAAWGLRGGLKTMPQQGDRRYARHQAPSHGEHSAKHESVTVGEEGARTQLHK